VTYIAPYLPTHNPVRTSFDCWAIAIPVGGGFLKERRLPENASSKVLENTVALNIRVEIIDIKVIFT
jgi:hypothetical protein